MTVPSSLRAVQKALERGRFARALNMLRRPRAPAERPYADFLAGEALRGRGYFAAAAERYRRLMSRSPFEDPVLSMEANLALCGCLHSLGRITEARRALARAEGLCGRLRLAYAAGLLRLERAMLERAAGSHALAVRLLRSELGRARDPQTKGYILWALGGALRFSGRLSASQGAFTRSLRSYLRAGDRLGAAYALCGLGGISRVRGKLGASKVFYSRALSHFVRTEDLFGTAYGHCGLANVLRQGGDWRGAQRRYLSSHRLYSALGDRVDLGYVEWGLGMVLSKTGRLRQAQKRFKRALSLFRAGGEKRGVALALLSSAQLGHALGRGPQAERLFDQAVRLSRGAGLKAHLESFT